MSTIAELEDKVKELMNEIETLKQKEKVKELEYPFEIGEKCWFINSSGSLFQDTWDTALISFDRYSQGNIFKTKEDAEREHDKRALLTRFRQFRDKCNGDWKQKQEDYIDFNGYHIEVYNGNGDMKLRSDWNPVCERFCLFGYLKKQADCDRAIELFGDEIKRLYLEW